MTALVNTSHSAQPGMGAGDRPQRRQRQTGRVARGTKHTILIRKRHATLAATISILAIGIPVAGASAAGPTAVASDRGVTASAPQPPAAHSGPTIIGPTVIDGTVTQGPGAGLEFSASRPQAISLLSTNAGPTVASGT